MKKIFYMMALLSAALTLGVACDEPLTEEEKEQVQDGIVTVAMVGEWGCVDIIYNETDESFNEADLDLFDEQGRPIVVYVFNLDGSYYSAINRVWNDHLTEGSWRVEDGYLYLDHTVPEALSESYKLVSFEDEILTMDDGEYTIKLKRLSEADKCVQLNSVEFTNSLSHDGKLHIDPNQQLENGAYQLYWKYDPEDYEPYSALVFRSSNEEVAYVDDEGRLFPTDGLTKGSTTITIVCDCVEASIDVEFEVIN